MSAKMELPFAAVCRITGHPRSTVYQRRCRGASLGWRPGPKTEMTDDGLLGRVHQCIGASLFLGDGNRKDRAHLCRRHAIRARKQRIIRPNGLLGPQRARRKRSPRSHAGKIVTDLPNLRWGTDGTMTRTKIDGWIWVFVLVGNHTEGTWAHVAKVGNRFPALRSLCDTIIDRFGRTGPDIAWENTICHDWASQYRAQHFLRPLTWLGIQDDAAYVGEPECKGLADRFTRTHKEQRPWAELFQDVDHLRQAVATFCDLYHTQWIIERLGHRTPRETYAAATLEDAA